MAWEEAVCVHFGGQHIWPTQRRIGSSPARMGSMCRYSLLHSLGGANGS